MGAYPVDACLVLVVLVMITPGLPLLGISHPVHLNGAWVSIWLTFLGPPDHWDAEDIALEMSEDFSSLEVLKWLVLVFICLHLRLLLSLPFGELQSLLS